MRRLSLYLLLTVVFALLWVQAFDLDPMETNAVDQLQIPTLLHPLGTDHLGRDVLSRLVHGGGRTLASAGVATLLAASFGMLIGLMRAIWKNTGDLVLSSVLNAVMAFPSIVLALVILTILGRGWASVAVAIGVSQIAGFARVVRSSVIVIESMLYVESAFALGAKRRHVLFFHILPNVAANIASYIGIVFGYSILGGAALSFLGLGGEPGVPDWGVMLSESRSSFRVAPWVAVFPGLAITLSVLYVNNVIDAFLKHSNFRE